MVLEAQILFVVNGVQLLHPLAVAFHGVQFLDVILVDVLALGVPLDHRQLFGHV